MTKIKQYAKSYAKMAVSKKNTYASNCGAGKEGAGGFQPGNTCGGDGDGSDTSADQGGGDKPKPKDSLFDYGDKDFENADTGTLSSGMRTPDGVLEAGTEVKILPYDDDRYVMQTPDGRIEFAPKWQIDGEDAPDTGAGEGGMSQEALDAYKDISHEDIDDMLAEKDITQDDAKLMREYVDAAQADTGAGEGGITPEQQSQLAEDAMSELNPTDRQMAESEIRELQNYSFDSKSDVQEYLDGQYGSPGEGVSPEITDAIWEGIGGERTQGGWVGKDRPAPSADTGAGEGFDETPGADAPSKEDIEAMEGLDIMQPDTGAGEGRPNFADMTNEQFADHLKNASDEEFEEIRNDITESYGIFDQDDRDMVESIAKERQAGAGEGSGATESGSRSEAFDLYKEDYGDDASEDDFNDAYQGHWEVEKDSMGREIPVEWAKDWVESIGSVSDAISPEQIQFNTDYDKWNAELDKYSEGYGFRKVEGGEGYEVYDRQDPDMPPTQYEYGFEAEDAAKEMNNEMLDENIASGGNQPSDGESYAEKYFNYQTWARDLVMGGEISVENGHVFWNR